MDERVAVVDHDPLRVLVAVVVIRLYSGLFQQMLAYIVGYRRHLHRGGAFAYYEVAGGGTLDAAQIYDGDSSSFLILYSLGDESDDVSLFGHFCQLFDRLCV